MMVIRARVNKIISGTFRIVEHITKTYDLRAIVLCKVLIGFEGMGPEVTVRFSRSWFYEDAPDVSIELWLHPENNGFVLIYSSLVPKTEEIEHESIDIQDMNEALPYFEKAIQLFELPTDKTE